MGVDEYLEAAPEPQQSTLREVRAMLRALLPGAVEGLSYGVPAFLVDGRPVAGYAWAKRHCSYFPHSGSILPGMADLLDGFDWGRGTLRFPVDEPPPRDLVADLVERRLAQVQGPGTGGSG